MTVVFAFLACLALFVVIGVLSLRRAKGTTEDYLLAGRDVSPWLMGLSSAATNNSGFMFIGLFGFTYRFGVQAVWLQLGWILGDVIAWQWIHRRVRERSGAIGATSVPTLLATDTDGRSSRSISVVAGLLTFLFLGGYAAGQLVAGATTLDGMFGWSPSVGVLIGAAIVVVYCFSGGLRASIWTDAAQALVMLVALGLLLGHAVAEVGGPTLLGEALAAANPELVQWSPDDLDAGFPLYFLGFVFGGMGAIGQPHILVRSMSVRGAGQDAAPAIRRARIVYFLWYVPFSVAAVATALYARVLLPELATTAPANAAVLAESALPALGMKLLPAIGVGVLLAGVFAATMSTADSQILSCSAAVTQDVAPRWARSIIASKLATLAVTGLAVVIALSANQSVFSLVLGAWSALGAAFGPLLVLRVFAVRVGPRVALAMMATGVATVFAWSYAGLSDDVFELLPGMVAPLVVFALSRVRAVSP